jgi:hypothetical protein
MVAVTGRAVPFVQLGWYAIRGRSQRDWYFIAEQLAPALHLARPVGRAALTHM